MTITRLLGLITILVPLISLASNSELQNIAAITESDTSNYQLTPDTGAIHKSRLYLSVNDSPAEPQTLPLGISQRDNSDQTLFPHLDIPTSPDWEGLKQDSKLFLLYQVAVVGVIYLMPESSSQWSDEDKNGNLFHKWDDNVNNLRKDKDDWAINYIGHPYFGSAYYVRARHRGYDRKDSFWYSAIMSTIYEYGIEALFEPVSIQDLIFTPVGGAIMGEYFMISRENIKRDIAAKGYATRTDNFKLFMTDPLGAINKKVNKLFGNKEDEARLELFPLVAHNKNKLASEPYLGLQAHYAW